MADNTYGTSGLDSSGSHRCLPPSISSLVVGGRSAETSLFQWQPTLPNYCGITEISRQAEEHARTAPDV